MIVVYSLGGSILAGQEPAVVRGYAEELKDVARDNQVYVVVGGGRIAREYIERARALGANEAFCDLIGVNATRLNAMLLIAALGSSAPPDIPRSYQEAVAASANNRVVVMGGLCPGQTTDAVAALLAEFAGADRLVIATSVDGVYTADPEVDPSAEKIERMTPSELAQMTARTELKAGSRSPVDPIAAKIIERSKIATAIVHGREMGNLKKGIQGDHEGTEIAG